MFFYTIINNAASSASFHYELDCVHTALKSNYMCISKHGIMHDKSNDHWLFREMQMWKVKQPNVLTVLRAQQLHFGIMHIV